MARRKKQPDERRDEILRIRVTGTERDQFERRAAVAGRKPSDFARAALLGGPVEAVSASLPAERHRLAAAALAEQIRRVGVNLNQWVRRMNETGAPPPAEAQLALHEIRALVRRAREL